MNVKSLSGEEFDRRFDDGEDMADYIDWNSFQRISEEPADNNTHATMEALSLPHDLMQRIDSAAERAHVSRETLAARLIAQGLDAAA